MIFNNLRSKSRVFCDLVVAGSLIVGAHVCEGSLAKGHDVTTSASAVLQTVTESVGTCYQVLISIGYGQYTSAVLCRSGNCQAIFSALADRFMYDVFVTLNGKPITPGTLVSDICVRDGSMFTAKSRMRGGMKAPQIVIHDNYFKQDRVRASFLQSLGARTVLPWVVPFSQRAKEFGVLAEYHDKPRYLSDDIGLFGMKKGDLKQRGVSQRLQKRVRATNDFELQSEFIDPKKFLEDHTDPVIVSFVEDIVLLCLQMLRAKDNKDRALAITVFIKLRSGNSLLHGVAGMISDVIHDVFDHQLQAEDDILNTVTDIRSLIANWESVQQSALVQQILRVYKYAVAMGVFSLIGVKIDEKVAFVCRKEMASPLMGVNFVTTVLDTMALFIQRALLFTKTGSWETFVHGPTSFGKWFDACQKVKREFQFRGDLEAQGTNYHKFVSDLKECIEEGRSILKFGQKTTGLEIANIKRMLNDLLMMQADLTTFREVQKSRRPPFGLLVW
jgi:hypothetical protein